jgi:hypothetical protein
MVAPVYSTDLITVATADEASGWVELTGTDGGGHAYNTQSAPAFQSVAYPRIQGSFAVTQSCTTSDAVGSLGFSSGGITIPTDGAVFVWQNFDSSVAMGTFAQGGQRIAIGSGLNDFNVWNVGGNDVDDSLYGGFLNHVVNPTVAADLVAGAPSGTLDYVASAVYSVQGIPTGRPHQCDAIRYGRGAAIFEFGEGTSGYTNLDGFSTANDLPANRWGLIQKIRGSYLYKGHWQFGTVTNGTHFVESDKTVLIDWTPKVTSNFNTIEITNLATIVNLTRITFTNIESTTTASRARWINTDDATVTISDCIFNDMSTFLFGSNTTITIAAFNRCMKVTQGGSTITGALFVESDDTAALSSDNLSFITETIFTSSGTGHAVEITATGTFDWNNIATGYAVVDGSTGNEIIYNNSGGNVIVIYEGGTVLTVRNGVGATTEVKDANPAIVDLGVAASFGALTTGAITGIGTCEGDMGALVGAVAVTIDTPAPYINYGTAAAEAIAAQAAMFTAIADIDSRVGVVIGPAALEIGGMTLQRGVYDIIGAATMTTAFTLDGSDDPDSVFIIRCGAAFSVTAAIEMALINGAQAKNVFWRLVGAGSLGAGAYVEGNFMGHSTWGFGAGANARGRLLFGDTAGTITFSGSTLENPDPGVTLTMIANVTLDGAEIRVYDLDTITGEFGTELSGVESNVGATYTFVGGAGSQNNVVWIQILKDGFIEFGQQITIPDTNGNFFPVLREESN